MSDDQGGCVGECLLWYWSTRVVQDKRPLNGCVCVFVCVYLTYLITPACTAELQTLKQL